MSNEQVNCVACESGECLEHGAHEESIVPAPAPAPAQAEGAVTREELQKFRKKVAKSVKRLNRAVKEARQQRTEQPTGVEPSPDTPAPPPAPERRMSDAAKLGLGVFRSCRKK